MLKWIKNVFSQPKRIDPNLVDLNNDFRKLELELYEKETMIGNLKLEINRLSENLESFSVQKSEAEFTQLFSRISSPVSQLLTQSYLVETGKPVQNHDIISVVNRLLNQLKDYGLDFIGSVSEIVSYNPDLHTPLNANVQIEQGDQVVIRFAGTRFNGAVIKKAMVENFTEGDK